MILFCRSVASNIQMEAFLQVTVPLPQDMDSTGTNTASELCSFLAPVNRFIASPLVREHMKAPLTFVDWHSPLQDWAFAYSHALMTPQVGNLQNMTIFLNEALNSIDSLDLDSLMERGVDAINNTSVGSIAAFIILLNE